VGGAGRSCSHPAPPVGWADRAQWYRLVGPGPGHNSAHASAAIPTHNRTPSGARCHECHGSGLQVLLLPQVSCAASEALRAGIHHPRSDPDAAVQPGATTPWPHHRSPRIPVRSSDESPSERQSCWHKFFHTQEHMRLQRAGSADSYERASTELPAGRHRRVRQQVVSGS
jgi:hypothetical protein